MYRRHDLYAQSQVSTDVSTDNTKHGSSFIIASIIGGAIAAPITATTTDEFNDTGRALFISLIFFLVSITFATACDFHPGTKAIVDEFNNSKVDMVGVETGDLKVVIRKGYIEDIAKEKVTAIQHDKKLDAVQHEAKVE